MSMTAEKLSYHIQGFDGPLDLLLTLISKNKMNIYDIPITILLEQYMGQIEAMNRENMDVASEFLEMAARLVHMKSVSLLPRQEEAEKLRMELTGQLIEYRQCKLVAAVFGEQISFDRITRQPLEIQMDPTYKGYHSPYELLSALTMAIGKGKALLPPKPESFKAIVSNKIVSVASQVVSVLRRLWKKRPVLLSALFADKQDKSERVAAFLAVLELVKGKRIRIEGEGEESRVRLIDGGEGFDD